MSLSFASCVAILPSDITSTNQLSPSNTPVTQVIWTGWLYRLFTLACGNFVLMHIFTGSIARSANLPAFSLLRGRFWGFSPRRGYTLHRWGWNLAWRRGPMEEGTFGPLFHAKFHPHRCNVSPLRGEKPQNRPLSKRNTGRFALRAMLPVKIVCAVRKPNFYPTVAYHASHCMYYSTVTQRFGTGSSQRAKPTWLLLSRTIWV